LILDAAAVGDTGDLFVLSMGEPVRIVDLANDLIRLSGRDPDAQPIEYVGLRPGEKLHEELFYDTERVEETSVSKVLRAIAGPPPQSLRNDVRQLLDAATGAQEDDLRQALLEYASTSAVPHREEASARDRRAAVDSRASHARDERTTVSASA
jgi:FlaA1/EpsC-like NDP-sugar epimerase